jgi:Predicted metal-sulfur cluster biosynthetic enzyme
MSIIKEKVINEIKKIYDPEIPVNIYELGPYLQDRGKG